MSLRLPGRRLALAASPTLNYLASTASPSFLRPLRPATQTRGKWGLSSFFSRRNRGAQNGDEGALGGQNLDDPKVRQRFTQKQQPQLPSSIFEDEFDDTVAESKRNGAKSGQISLKTQETTSFRLDPDPRSRIRWERKKVIQMVRRNGRVSRSERIAQTEKQITHKSPFLETSVKKLVHLARQIQGKTLDDAILQMTYSKKKMASEVKYQLEEARDLAVVTRGMGLGKAGERSSDSTSLQAIKIRTKDGNTLTVDDPTNA
ncbi:hypothetical protein C8035_v007085 [Colletotrichum spinosum]|uniref:54S ribosomal protein L22 n=1 Tax=Colletotrichum spinosum TaxID=1347390 RepID=A0A4R8PXJ2_9PEZI|nr:hypothetical protein C8035_v007085 [Colletotrichum spinosum]